MDRRKFLFLGAGAASLRGLERGWGQALGEPHRLPGSDLHYRRTSGYVEEVPVPEYHWASAAAYERFRDMKFGVRVHWGLYSIEGLPNESWPFLQKTFPERAKYNELYRTWNPVGFDAESWMELFDAAGAKMFSFTTKHHEGFSMYDTRTVVRSRTNWVGPGGPQIEGCDLAYSIMETPFRRDVSRELCDAAHKRGIKIDLYFSHPDWYDADFRPYALHPLQTESSMADKEVQGRMRQGAVFTVMPGTSAEESARMMARHRAQLTELLTNYGKIDMLCLDQWLGPAVWPELRKTLVHLRSLQPDVMLRARGIGNYGDYYTPERFVPGGKENTGVPWFVIYPLGTSFSYEADASKYKGAEWIVRNVVDSVAKGGNFMVGVGPDGDGRFAPEAARQLRQTGEWLRVNGEGIYATRPSSGRALAGRGCGSVYYFEGCADFVCLRFELAGSDFCFEGGQAEGGVGYNTARFCEVFSVVLGFRSGNENCVAGRASVGRESTLSLDLGIQDCRRLVNFLGFDFKLADISFTLPTYRRGLAGRLKGHSMIQTGILNPQINFLLSRVRHTNTFVIADRGFPNWPDVMTIDISLVSGMPRVVDVVTAIRLNFKIGKVFQAEEFLATNAAAIRESYDAALADIVIIHEPHLEIKKRVPQAIGIIRTGDTARYGNLVLESA